jgi:uncharacterized protein (DUF1810 family)
MADPFNLSRFIEAQDEIYSRALGELRVGEKRSHWMWFIFPQVAGLGHSAMAQRYAIQSRPETEAYLAHAVLGARLLECTQAVLDVPGKSASAIFGSPDDMKFRSSMTLFDAVGDRAIFGETLQRFYQGERDFRTVAILGSWN